MDLRVAGGQRIEKRSVAAAEVADADHALGVGDDLEVAAGEKLVRDADVPLASDDQAGRRQLELLTFQRTVDTDKNDAFRLRLGDLAGGHRLEYLVLAGDRNGRRFRRGSGGRLRFGV